MKKCLTKYCRNESAPGRRFCYKCKSRREKINNPEFYYFNHLRGNAKRRGKEFNLTLNEFKQFCNETGYLEKKGKDKNSMTIDRIDSKKGYSINNIRILSHYENSIRADKDDCPF